MGGSAAGGILDREASLDRRHLERLLERVAGGELSPADALERLTDTSLGFATLDTQRAIRTGVPETIYGAGKRPEQVAAIVDRLVEAGQDALVTRASPEHARAVLQAHPEARWHELARVVHVPVHPWRDLGRGKVLVACAGTSDLPVAEEAAVVAHALGNRVDRLNDVGVAGIHRVLDRRERLLEARVIVVVAGMEGALASVVAGMVDRPVIAVPTSVGYGAAFGGLAALLGMLNACAPGVSVVNIDNGYGAAYQATLINRLP